MSKRRSTARRNIRKRGALPSFGDIILPVVGVAAVGLLVLAARQFFLKGFKTSPAVSSTKAYAEAPALIAEREKKSELETLLPPVSIDKSAKTDVNAADLEAEKKKEEEFLAMAVATQAPAPQVSVTEKLQTTKVSTPVKKQSQAQSTQPAKKVSQPATSSSTSISKQWRVQIGAYTSKAGAQEAAKKVKKAGYKAIVYQNPASKHVKVWVQGGPTKASAERVVEAMKKIGYKGSFVFPPAK